MPVRLCRPKAWFVDGFELTSATAQHAAAPHSEPRSCATQPSTAQPGLSQPPGHHQHLLVARPHVDGRVPRRPRPPCPRESWTGSTATLLFPYLGLMWARTYSCDRTSPVGAVAQASDCSLRTTSNVRGVVANSPDREAQLLASFRLVLASDIDSDPARHRAMMVLSPPVTQQTCQILIENPNPHHHPTPRTTTPTSKPPPPPRLILQDPPHPMTPLFHSTHRT